MAKAPYLRLASGVLAFGVLAVSMLGCGARTIVVAVPPRIDLAPYKTIGVIEFTSADPADKLNPYATQKFMTIVQAAQPGVRFLELGSLDRLQQTTGRRRLDLESIRLVGQKYGVDTVFSGSYEILNQTPQIRFGEDLSSVSASARVRINLAVKHWDTKTGAIIWTNSGRGEWPVANVSAGIGQPVSLGVTDPRDRYGDYITRVIYAVTDEFRVQYERRPVPQK